jgi:hypothetical protein
LAREEIEKLFLPAMKGVLLDPKDHSTLLFQNFG